MFILHFIVIGMGRPFLIGCTNKVILFFYILRSKGTISDYKTTKRYIDDNAARHEISLSISFWTNRDALKCGKLGNSIKIMSCSIISTNRKTRTNLLGNTNHKAEVIKLKETPDPTKNAN